MDADGLRELVAPFAAVEVRRMFSGKGIYAEGLMSAMEMEGEVYSKCGGASEALFAQAGSPPFISDARRPDEDDLPAPDTRRS